MTKHVDVHLHPFEHPILNLTYYVNPADELVFPIYPFLGQWFTVGVIFPIAIIFLCNFFCLFDSYFLFFVFAFMSLDSNLTH